MQQWQHAFKSYSKSCSLQEKKNVNLLLIFHRLQEEKLWDQCFILCVNFNRKWWIQDCGVISNTTAARSGGKARWTVAPAACYHQAQQPANGHFVSLAARTTARTRCLQEWGFAGKEKKYEVQPLPWANVDLMLALFCRRQKNTPFAVLRPYLHCNKKAVLSCEEMNAFPIHLYQFLVKGCRDHKYLHKYTSFLNSELQKLFFSLIYLQPTGPSPAVLPAATLPSNGPTTSAALPSEKKSRKSNYIWVIQNMAILQPASAKPFT